MLRLKQLAYDRLLEDSILEDEDPIFEDSMTSGKSVSMQDLLNSPEFIEQQRLILLECQTARLRIGDDQRKTNPRLQEVHRRSRPSSIAGLKLTCPICLESLISRRSSNVKMATQCGHIFCQKCIENVCEAARKKKALCPVCRKDVGELRKVYF